MARPLPPPPLLVARPLVDELFFCGFPKQSRKNRNKVIFLTTVPLRPYPLPPSSLMALGTFFLNKKSEKKILMVRS